MEGYSSINGDAGYLKKWTPYRADIYFEFSLNISSAAWQRGQCEGVVDDPLCYICPIVHFFGASQCASKQLMFSI